MRGSARSDLQVVFRLEPRSYLLDHFATIGVLYGTVLQNHTFQLSPSGITEIAISVGQSQISSISTLMEASSSAAVLLGFFMTISR
jgi:hypothetical protein